MVWLGDICSGDVADCNGLLLDLSTAVQSTQICVKSYEADRIQRELNAKLLEVDRSLFSLGLNDLKHLLHQLIHFWHSLLQLTRLKCREIELPCSFDVGSQLSYVCHNLQIFIVPEQLNTKHS